MTSVSQYSVVGKRRMPADTSVASAWSAYQSDKSATRIDVALLVSALFLQRFSLPYGATRLGLPLVLFGLILVHQFLSGKLLIQYDRLLWYLAFAFACTCSLLLNLKGAKLTSYAQSVVVFSLFTLSRSSSPDQYKRTLQAFQFLVMLISCLAIAQFPAQFVVNGEELIRFYGIVPNILLGEGGEWRWGTGGYGTIRELGGGLIKSNGIFLNEPSTLSQVTALGIVIEILEFHRPRYLLVMTLGFLVAYSGSGLMVLLLFLPLASLRHDKALPYSLVVGIFALGLFATGIIDLTSFTSRVGEFESPGASGFGRFVSPFWAAANLFDMEGLQALLLGSGTGTSNESTRTWYGAATYDATWVKIFHEYGIIGSFIFACFLGACLRRSRCHSVAVAALIFTFLFMQGMILTAIPLCTLNGPERRRGRIDETREYRSAVVTGGKTV